MASLWLISLRPLPTTLSLQMEIWLSEPETTPGLLHRTVARHPYWLVVGNLGAKTSSLPEHPLTHRYSHQPALLLCNWPPFPALPPLAGGVNTEDGYDGTSALTAAQPLYDTLGQQAHQEEPLTPLQDIDTALCWKY